MLFPEENMKIFFNKNFAPTSLPANLAPRHDLLHHMHRAALSGIVFVSAPAGSGKTISTRLWLAHSGRKAIWLDVTDDLNCQADFYTALGESLASVQPANEALRRILDAPAFTEAPAENAAALAAAFAEDGEFHALVLDDMHRIRDGEIWKSLAAVLAALPANCVAFLLSRREPNESFPKTVGGKPPARVTGQQLAFSAEEIGDYFKTIDKELTRAETTAAHLLTGGWAIGVRALAMSGSFAMGGRDLEAYLQANIWESWDPGLRDNLLRLSIVEEITPALAKLLTGRDDVLQLLDRMAADNAFVIRSGGGYRFHQLLLDFLAKKRKTDLSDEAALHGIAGRYFLEWGMQYEAFRAFVQARDMAGVEQCMFDLHRYTQEDNSVASHAGRLRAHFVDIVPDDDLDRLPYLLVNVIWYHYISGDAGRMFHYLDRLYAVFPRLVAEHEQFRDIAVIIAMLDNRRSMAETMEKLDLGHAPDRASPLPQTVTVSENLPFFHRSHRDYTGCAADMDGSFSLLVSLLRPYFGDSVVLWETGVRGCLHYEMNDLQAATAYARKAAAMCELAGVMEVVFSAEVLQAAIDRAAGDEDAADRRMDALYRVLREKAVYLLPNFEALRFKHLLMDAGRAAAHEWFKRYFVVESNQPELHRIHQHLTTARAHCVLAQTEAAERWLLAVRRIGVDFGRPLDVAEADAVLSCVEWNSGRKKEARARLRDALFAMQPYGFIRVFADEAGSILPVLKAVVKDLPWEDMPGGLREDYVKKVLAAAKVQAKRHPGVARNIRTRPLKLSPQQTMVLEGLAREQPLAEIAAAVGLSLTTVKSHAYVLYKKLDAHNAAGAVARARELGLLE